MRRVRTVDLVALTVVLIAAVDVAGTPATPASMPVSPIASVSAPPAVVAAPDRRPSGAPAAPEPRGTPSAPIPGFDSPRAAARTSAPTLEPTGGPTVVTGSPVSSPQATMAPPVPTTDPTPKPTAAPVAAPPPLSACPVFPASNVWNRPVDGLPVAVDSDVMLAAIGVDRSLHPDFSDAGGYGIPYNVVGAVTPRSTVSFEYDDESDHVGYPIPPSPMIEAGPDRHLLMVDTDGCRLYELFAAASTDGAWQAGSGATWDLRSNELRTETWTSADAAGLPILPGLARYEEVASGEIRHALRFTAPRTCDGYIYPARHAAGSGSCATYPPMGLRVRLRADVDLAPFGPQARVVLVALQRYGAILADNGSAWYVTGAPASGWDDDDLHGLHGITGEDFEVVDTTGFVNG